MKVKWVAWITLGMLLLGLMASPISAWAAAIVSLSNYLLFFVPALMRRSLDQRKIIVRRTQFEAASQPASESLYRCAVCGRTELTHPELEFRVGSDGNDYCVEHRRAPGSGN